MSSRSRGFCFTINNYTRREELDVKEVDCDYLVYGREVGESGTPHLQGFLRFRNARTFTSVSKLLPRAHVEIARNVQASIEYCKKGGDFFEKGDQPQQSGGDPLAVRAARNKRLREVSLDELVMSGELSILQVPAIKKARLILAQESLPYEHEDVRGLWIHGPPGVGKSHMAREFNDVYPKAQNKWFDGYAGQSNIVLDDFDKQGICLGHYLKIWADKWSCTGEVKGGTVNLVHRQFIVTSNYHPEDLWTEDSLLLDAILRRFKIIYKNKE